jgi:hypothetical protein
MSDISVGVKKAQCSSFDYTNRPTESQSRLEHPAHSFGKTGFADEPREPVEKFQTKKNQPCLSRKSRLFQQATRNAETHSTILL